MKQVRVLGVEVDSEKMSAEYVEDQLNQQFIKLEKNGSRIMNVIPYGRRGFLILHEEPFNVMP